MTQHANHFDEFKGHTELKHAILNAYIVEWAMKLFMWGQAGDTLAIVDGFAGAGHDEAGNDGSPIIAARRALVAMAAAKGKKSHLRDPKIRIVAVEKNRGRYQQLVRCMKAFSDQRPGLITLLPGELNEQIGNVIEATGGVPTFYFLDPFGVSGLDAETYRKALAGKHNEIFALFSDIGATRLHGLITADRVDASDEIERILSQPSLFAQFDAEDIAHAEAAATRANQALDASIPASREHLTRALGSDEWVAELAAAKPEDRPDTFLQLFRRALVAAGAKYVVSIPMRDDRGQRVYSLVHASKSASGFVAMKTAIGTGLGKAPISERARQRMICSLSVDIGEVVAALRQGLAGRQFFWSDQPRSGAAGLNTLVLQHSAMFPLQSQELKAALAHEGILQRIDRKQVCVFPPLP